MTLRFQPVCTIASVLCLALALVWLIAPELILWSWGVDYTASAGIVGRRSAALFLGIGVMMARMRTATPSTSRTALADGFALSCVILAALGLGELWVGHAGPGIALAVTVELLAAWALAFSVRTEARPPSLRSHS